jgi:hypothetical protein
VSGNAGLLASVAELDGEVQQLGRLVGRVVDLHPLAGLIFRSAPLPTVFGVAGDERSTAR